MQHLARTSSNCGIRVAASVLTAIQLWRLGVVRYRCHWCWAMHSLDGARWCGPGRCEPFKGLHFRMVKGGIHHTYDVLTWSACHALLLAGYNCNRNSYLLVEPWVDSCIYPVGVYVKQAMLIMAITHTGMPAADTTNLVCSQRNICCAYMNMP